MHFLAVQGRVEHAGEDHVFAAAPQQMLVVLIQYIQGAGADLVDLAVVAGFHFAVAADAVHGFQVVLVVDGGFGVFVDGGDVERKAHVVVLQKHPGAFPGFGDYATLGVLGFFQGSDDHVYSYEFVMYGVLGQGEQGRHGGLPLQLPWLGAVQVSGRSRNLVALQHFGDGPFDNVQAALELFFRGDQGRQDLDHLAFRAAGFNDQAMLEALGGDGIGQLTVFAFQATHHAAPFGAEHAGGVFAGDTLQVLGQHFALVPDFLGKAVVLPEGFQGGPCRDKGVVVAAEGAVVLARFPDIQFLAEQGQGKGQAEAAEGFGQGDDVGLDAGFLKAEEVPGAAAAGLDVVDDQQYIVLAADLLQVAQPFGRGHVEPAFTLYRLHDDRGREVAAATVVGEHLVEVLGGVGVLAHVAVKGNVGDPLQVDAGAFPVETVGGGGHRAQGDAMEAVAEGNDLGAAGDLAGNFQGRFHAVGAGRPGELGHVVFHAPGNQDVVPQGLQESGLGLGVHVQAMGDAVFFDVGQQRFLQDRIVMAIVEGAGTGEKVQIAIALVVIQVAALSAVENHRKGAGVAANF